MKLHKTWFFVQLGFAVVCAKALGDGGRPYPLQPSTRTDSARLIAGNGSELRGGIESGTVARSTAPHVSLRPTRTVAGGINGVGDTIVVNAPADVILEGYYGGWGSSGQKLKTFQLTLGTASFSNGVGGALTHGDVPCVTDADCVSALGPLVNAPNAKCSDFLPGRCNHAYQDLGRPDYITGFVLPGCSQSLFSCGDTTLSSGTLDSGVDKYGYTVVLHVPADAAGTYEVEFDEPGLPGTFMQIADGSLLTITELHHAFIQVSPDDKCIGGPLDGAACSQHAECPGGLCQVKNRFISFFPSVLAPSGGIQVTLVNLDSNSVANPAAYNGTVRWVGAPTLGVNDAPSGTINVAPLQCAFYSQNWSSVGRLHLFGPTVVPGSQYDVRLCSTAAGPCTAPLRITTAKFGDVIPPLVTGQPNFQDIVSINEKFMGSPLGPSKTRTKLREPVNPSLGINFLEISANVSAFQGKTYKQMFPTPPPTCP